NQIIDGISAQEHVERDATGFQRRRQPERGVVLLFERGAIGRLDDLKNLLAHWSAPHLVGMTSVLVEDSTNFARSAGLPRRVPGIASATPRSSTHRPQLSQSCFTPRCCASVRRAAIQSFVVG